MLKEKHAQLLEKLRRAPVNETELRYAEYVITAIKDVVAEDELSAFAISFINLVLQNKTVSATKASAEIIEKIAEFQRNISEMGKISNKALQMTIDGLVRTDEIPGIVGSMNFESSRKYISSIKTAARQNQTLIISDTIKEPVIEKDGTFKNGTGWSGYMIHAMPTPDGLSFRMVMPSEITPLNIREDIVFTMPIELMILGFNDKGKNLRRAVADKDGLRVKNLETGYDVLDKIENIDTTDLGISSDGKKELLKNIISSYEKLGFVPKGLNIIDALRSIKTLDGDNRYINVSEVTLALLSDEQQVVGAAEPFREIKFVSFTLAKEENSDTYVQGPIEMDNGMKLTLSEMDEAIALLNDFANANFDSMAAKLNLVE